MACGVVKSLSNSGQTRGGNKPENCMFASVVCQQLTELTPASTIELVALQDVPGGIIECCMVLGETEQWLRVVALGILIPQSQ